MHSSPLWLTNAHIVTQNSSRQLIKAHIRIDHGKITDLKSGTQPKIARTRVRDCTGLVILPGFVQTHIHLCQTLFRNKACDLELLEWLKTRIWPMEAKHTYQTLYASAQAGIAELISSGTTCILDMGTVRHTEAIFEAALKTGIRANIGKCLMDNPKTCPPSLLDSTDGALTEALGLFKKWNDSANGRIRASFAPRFAISCTERLLKSVARLSRKYGAIIHTHASENLDELKLVKKLTGLENIKYLDHVGCLTPRTVLAHCVWTDSHDHACLKKRGTHVTHCPTSNLKLASGIAPIPKIMAQKINVALGADGAACNDSLSMFQEMKLAALLHKPSAGPKAIRAQEALDMATRNGAKALNWWNEIGSIEIGKRADLIVLDLHAPNVFLPDSVLKQRNSEAMASAIVYSSSPQNLKLVLIDGKIAFEPGIFYR